MQQHNAVQNRRYPTRDLRRQLELLKLEIPTLKVQGYQFTSVPDKAFQNIMFITGWMVVSHTTQGGREILSNWSFSDIKIKSYFIFSCQCEDPIKSFCCISSFYCLLCCFTYFQFKLSYMSIYAVLLIIITYASALFSGKMYDQTRRIHLYCDIRKPTWKQMAVLQDNVNGMLQNSFC